MSKASVHVAPIEPELFATRGFVVVRQLISKSMVAELRRAATSAMDPLIGPVEFEAEVGYPGAPTDPDDPGGNTPRRLLHAYGRDPLFAQLAMLPRIKASLEAFMGTDRLCLSQNHHNCVMTKHPGYSSSTSWHQDIRYWSFDRAELVSIWCALGDENRENGALAVIPGSHLERVDRGRLDRDLFLREGLRSNQALLERQEQIELVAGDVLFFHCRLFHAAGRNLSRRVKLSAVFTYHAVDNHPIPGTRSDRYPAIPLI